MCGWLFAIARNKVVDELVRRRRLELWATEFVNAELERRFMRKDIVVQGWLDNDELANALEELAPARRQVVVLRFFLGFSYTETAVAMSRTEASVRQLQHRALDDLAGDLNRVALPASNRRRTPIAAVARERPQPVLQNRRFALTHPQLAHAVG